MYYHPIYVDLGVVTLDIKLLEKLCFTVLTGRIVYMKKVPVLHMFFVNRVR